MKPEIEWTTDPRAVETILRARWRRRLAYLLIFGGQVLVILAVAAKHEAWPW